VSHAVTGNGERECGLALAEADQVALDAGAGREALRADVERLEQIRLAGSVLADDEDDSGGELEIEGAVRAVVPERDAADDQPGLSLRAGSA
jgi:hypothetical protein